MSKRSELLASRLEEGARALAAFASTLDEAEWLTRMSDTDPRPIGVVVHHVASVYPVEIELAQLLASGQAITGVTVADIHAMNARHAREFAGVSRADAFELLQRNSAAAASAIRALSDAQLDLAAPVSLYGDAPLTCQFVLEDHAVRHSWHHLAGIRRAVGERTMALGAGV